MKTKYVILAFMMMSALGCKTSQGVREARADTERYVKALKSSDIEARREAAQVLGTLRGGVMKGAPALINALDDADVIVSSTAAASLRQLLSSDEISRSRDKWMTIWRREKKRILRDKKLDPQDAAKLARAKVNNDRGVAEINKGAFIRAERFFRESLAANADDPITYSNLARALMPQLRIAEAIDSLRVALELDPHFHQAHYNLAQAYFAMTQAAELSRAFADTQYLNALQHIESALKLAPQGVATWLFSYNLLKAKIYFNLAISEERYPERLDFYMRSNEAIIIARHYAPNSVDVRTQAALSAYAIENYFQAFQDVKVVYKLGYEMNEDFLYKLGVQLKRIYYDKGITPPVFPWENKSKKTDKVSPALRTPAEE